MIDPQQYEQGNLMADDPDAGSAAPVVVPEQQQQPPSDTITLANGLTVKKEHLGYLNGNPFIKPEFRPQYTSGLPAGYGSGQPGKSLAEDITFGATEVAKNMSLPAKAMGDFFVDATTTVGNRLGMNAEILNKQWDQLTKEDTVGRQQVRKFLSVALPGFGAGRLLGLGTKALGMTGLARGAAVTAGSAVSEAAIIGLSDEGLEEPGISRLAKAAPWLPIPDSWVAKPGESTEITKWRNIYEAGVTSIAADVLGVLSTVPGKMKWFQPKDEVAKAYKQGIVDRSDPETLSRLVEIEQALATKPNRANAAVLQEEAKQLRAQLEETGSSELTTRGRVEKAVEQNQTIRQSQLDEEAILKLEADPEIFGTFVPEITPGLATPNQLARQTISPEAIAKNMADTTAIKRGISTGDPAPMLSGPFLKNGLVLGRSRNAVAGLAEAARDAGDFDAIVGNIRLTRQDMKNAAWDIYGDIIRAGSKEDVAKLFAENRAVLPLAEDLKITYLNPVQQEQAATAMADLTDLWLGRDVTETSARVMDTLGREIASAAEAGVRFEDMIDDNRVQEIIGDKLEYLMNEVGLNKFIAGWQLKNQDWIQRMRKSSDPGELAELINNEFTQALNSRHASIKRFRQNLEEVKKTNPDLAKTFYNMFSETDGDVDTIEKLFNWATEQVSPMGMLLSPGDRRQMNHFAKGAWGVIMNNVLSIKSTFNAVKGNVASMIFQPITSIMGHGIGALVQQDIEPLKRAFYYHAADFQTQARALRAAGTRMVRTHNDYDFMMQTTRKDYAFQQSRDWEALDTVAAEWEKTGQFGKLRQYQWSKANRDIARMSWYRVGMTGMGGVDAYTDSIQATIISRTRAYDDVFTKNGKVTPELLQEAEDVHYNNIFDQNGVLTDEAAKNASGEISLNLDDPISNYLDKAVTAVPAFKSWFMFPKTSVNDLKYALSYTPLGMIPPFKNKYGKVLLAGNDIEKIKEAMAEHGIKNFDATPNAMAMYERLKHEYMGRLAFGQMLGISASQYALAGNIRGNGPTNPAERKKLKDNYGWQEKTIKIGDKWVSYDGIPVLEHVLSLVGDAAYYYNDIGSSVYEDTIDKLGWSISATYFNQTPLHGIEPLLAALNGDESAFERMKANMIRMAIPQSGNLGIISDTITSSQKAIYKDMMGYVKNRLPFASGTLPEQRDLWTGKPLKQIDNPAHRALNALTGLKVSDEAEPWRDWLLSTGYDGINRIRYTSQGSREYTNEEQDLISEFMGEEQLWKKVDAIKDNEAFNAQLDELRAFRRSGASYEEVKLKESELPVYQYLDKIVSEAKRNAELRLISEYPDIWRGVEGQGAVDAAMQSGDIQGAQDIAEWTDKSAQELRTIREMRK